VTVQDSDSNGQKFGGSLLNAVVFIAVVTAMTFVIVLLFKYGVRPCWR
jgi:acyl-CoA hydrolase